MNIGTLTIEMAANVARLRQDMDAAKNTVNTAMLNIQKSVNVAKGALAGLGAALSVGAFAAWVKSSIDAADEMSKLSQKTGIAVKDLAGLQLAYRQSGLEAGALQMSMSKLAVGVLNGNDALKAMAIQTRNADGSLKSTREVLGLVADKFASYEDGIGKTALAIELFGKSGADLIPMLNGGSEALAEFDEMARKLGLTMDEATARNAEKFNDTLDLLGQGLSGISRQVAADLLPTLTGLAGEFLNSMTSGDRLKKVADVLSMALRGLYVAGIGIIEVFSTVGKTLGGVSAAVVAALSGDFTGAANILKEMKADIGQGWVESLEAAKRAFTTTGNAGVEAMVAVAGASKKAAPEVGELAKAAKKTTDEFEALLAKINGKEVGIDSDFHKNIGILKDGLDAGRITLEQYIATVQTYISQQKFFQDELKESEKRLTEYNKQVQKEFEDRQKSLQSAEAMIEQIEFETEALRMTNEQRETAIKLRELERLGIKAGTAEYEEFAERIRAAVTGKEAVEASIEQQRKAKEEWQKTWDQIGQSLSDSLMQGGKNAAEYIKGLFRSMVLRPIVQAIVAPLTGALGIPGTANAAGAGGGSNMLDIASTASSFYNVLTKGVSGAIADGFGKIAGSSFGQSIGLSTPAMGPPTAAGQMPTTLTATGQNIGAALGYAGNALAGYGIQKFISNGYKVGNGKLVDFATLVASAIFGPVAGVVAGVFNRAFGRKLVDAGIQGTFGGEAGFEGRNFTFEKGGWFRSDKTRTSPLDVEMQDSLGMAFRAMQVQAAVMADSLNLGTDAIANFTSSFKISLKGLSQEQAQAALTAELEKVEEGLAKAALGAVYEQLAKDGETAVQTLTRLSSSLQSVNSAFDVLGYALYESSIAGAQMASSLIDAFGGMEQLTQAVSSYYENFYTEAERHATATRQLTAELARFGVVLPASRDAYRALVEAQDLTTEAGRNTYAVLIQLSSTFAELTPSVEKLDEASVDLGKSLRSAADIAQERAGLERQLLSLQGNTAALREREVSALDESNVALQNQIWALQDANAALDRAKSATDAAMSAVERAIDAASSAAAETITETFNALTKALTAQKEAAQVARDAASENVNAIRGVFDLLKTQIAELVGEAGAGMSAAQGRAFIEQAIGTARTTGYLPEQAQLSEAIAAARSGLSTSNYASSFELRRDRLLLAGKLGELQTLTGAQLTIAERQLAAAELQVTKLEDQIEQARAQYEADIAQNKAFYDAQLAAAQLQVDVMRGVDRSVMSVAAAIAGLGSAIASERSAAAAVQAASAAPAAAAASTAKNPAMLAAAKALYYSTHTGYSTPLFDAAVAPFGGSQQAFAALGWDGSRESAAAIKAQYGFAAGGLHGGGMRIVGENGPEIEVTGPARYYSASETAGMLGGGADVAEELRNLRADNQAQARAMVQLQSRMTRLLERWDGDGLPEERSVTA